MRPLALLLLAAVVVAGCGSASPGPPLDVPAPGTAKPPASSHVVTIVMENKEAGEVLGSRSSPYLRRLARRVGVAVNSYGIRHPSLPNYLALTSGSTHGIASDCTTCHVAGRNVVDQLEEAHLSWKAYLEGLPRPCFAGASTGAYAKKHDPFMYYDDVRTRPARCRNVVPYQRLAGALRRGALPDYAFVVPDMCNDTHDCGVRTGDRFLAHLVPALLRQLGPHGVLIITWDEGGSDAGCCGGARGGRIPTLVAGPDVRPGARMSAPVTHYGVLRSTEDILGLGHLGAAADDRNGSLRPLFERRPDAP